MTTTVLGRSPRNIHGSMIIRSPEHAERDNSKRRWGVNVSFLPREKNIDVSITGYKVEKNDENHQLFGNMPRKHSPVEVDRETKEGEIVVREGQAVNAFGDVDIEFERFGMEQPFGIIFDRNVHHGDQVILNISVKKHGADYRTWEKEYVIRIPNQHINIFESAKMLEEAVVGGMVVFFGGTEKVVTEVVKGILPRI